MNRNRGTDQPPPIRIDRCVCTGRRFADLCVTAARERLDLDGLGRATGAGVGCGLCRPYLREMLRSGTTVFDRVLHEP